jgi:hypothetical protein
MQVEHALRSWQSNLVGTDDVVKQEHQSYICSTATIISPSSSPPAAFSDLRNLQQQNVTDAARLCHVPLCVVLSAVLHA